MFVWLDCSEVCSLFLFRNGLALSRPIRSLRGISQRYWEEARLECHQVYFPAFLPKLYATTCFFPSPLTVSLTINGHMATGLTLSLPILPCLALSYLFSFPLMNDSFLISVQIDILNTSSLGLTKWEINLQYDKTFNLVFIIELFRFLGLVLIKQYCTET